MTDEEIIEIRERHQPIQGEPFDTLAFGREVAVRASAQIEARWHLLRDRFRCDPDMSGQHRWWALDLGGLSLRGPTIEEAMDRAISAGQK